MPTYELYCKTCWEPIEVDMEAADYERDVDAGVECPSCREKLSEPEFPQFADDTAHAAVPSAR